MDDFELSLARRYQSRKFFLAVLIWTATTALLWFGKIKAVTWADVSQAVLWGYCFADVAEGGLRRVTDAWKARAALRPGGDSGAGGK